DWHVLASLYSIQVFTMKSFVSVAAIILTVCVLVVSVGGASADSATVNTEQVADQPANAHNPTGRFQISSFATEKSGAGVGYYVIDSTTGEIWMNYGDNKPSKVSEPLLK
ncbi:hypothetical protein, partial [Roseiconus lacunae]